LKDDILRIDRLSKEFNKIGAKDKNDKFKAVDSLSLSLFKNQILCLLGHNGAGKTTTI
jgi:ABC-type multidrug transport system ATPase subunit